jgi:hypothetical protein
LTPPEKEPEAKCPICGHSDRVLRVSALYVAGLEEKFHKQARTQPDEQSGSEKGTSSALPDFKTWEEFPPGSLAALNAQIAPPATRKQVPTRPLHPDMVMGGFCLISTVFIYGIVSTQPGMMAVAAPFLIGLAVFYIWQRKKLVARYHTMITSQRESEERVKRAIERWLWLRCCARDKVVFLPGKEAVPLERMNELLF